MKANELTKCRLCDKGLAHDGSPMFIKVTVDRYILNAPAVQRQAGLEMMIGPLAGIMGPDEDMAKKLPQSESGLVCMTCAFSQGVLELDERIRLLREKDEECPACKGERGKFDHTGLCDSEEKPWVPCPACDGTGKRKGHHDARA